MSFSCPNAAELSRRVRPSSVFEFITLKTSGGDVEHQRTGDLDVVRDAQIEVPQRRVSIVVDLWCRQHADRGSVAAAAQLDEERTRVALAAEQIAADLESLGELVQRTCS